MKKVMKSGDCLLLLPGLEHFTCCTEIEGNLTFQAFIHAMTKSLSTVRVSCLILFHILSFPIINSKLHSYVMLFWRLGCLFVCWSVCLFVSFG